MPRNLDRRVELMTPILDEEIAKRLYEILKVQISDNILAYELSSNGEYKKVEVKKDEKSIDSHLLMEE